MDGSAGLGDLLEIVADNLELVLLLLVILEGDTVHGLGGHDVLLADEVSDFDVRAFDDEFHGEVCVCSLHGKAVALGNTSHHVVDVGDDSLWDGVQLGAWEPAGDEDGVAFDSHLQWAHVEVALELTTWAGDGDLLVLEGDSAAIVDLDVSSVLKLHTTRKRKAWCGD